MPAADLFIDTNVLLYAISTDPSQAAKSAIAQQLLATQNWAWSAQVAAEFINVSTSARRPIPLTLPQAEGWIDTWLAFFHLPCVSHVLANVESAPQPGIERGRTR